MYNFLNPNLRNFYIFIDKAKGKGINYAMRDHLNRRGGGGAWPPGPPLPNKRSC